MTDWFLVSLVFVLIVAAFVTGMQCRRLPKWAWAVLFLVPVGFWLAMRCVSYVPSLVFEYEPVAWLFALRRPFLISSLIIAFAMGIVIPQVQTRRLRVLLSILMLAGLVYHFAIPMIGPLVVRNRLRAIHTVMDHGVCLQSTSWTCGPAASVTALRALGIPAEEGQLAILSYTTPMFGTDETLLARAMEQLYRDRYITTDLRYVRSLRELKGQCPALVAIQLDLTVAHLVTVLKVTDKTVTYGDPLQGRVTCSIEDFEEVWLHRALLVYRLPPVPMLVRGNPSFSANLLIAGGV
jgi:uncharacterized protein